MSLRIVPSPSHQPTTLPSASAPSAPGIHDTLRAAQHDAPSPHPQSTHPLEARLSTWRATQTTLKFNLLRRQFGLAEPVKRAMELRIVGAGEWRPAVLGGGAGVHGDILMGRESEVEWEDVFGEEGRILAGGMGEGAFHAEMEGRFGMDLW